MLQSLHIIIVKLSLMKARTLMSSQQLTPGLDNSIKVRGEGKALLQVGRVWPLRSALARTASGILLTLRQNIRHTPVIMFYDLVIQ